MIEFYCVWDNVLTLYFCPWREIELQGLFEQSFDGPHLLIIYHMD